ncbi:MAG: response regulator [Bdellovibrionaceae bacterium]|nr:response regulator [Pseudobdellovibrionaceae bacterium]
MRTDPTRLRQILTNLIGNAIKFTEKGHVTLSVRMASPPKAGTPVRLEFTVADTGIGIPSELKEKLFQPFTQLEVSTSRRFGGTGLGLTLSKQLVQALGGDLSLQTSVVGQGSTFAFSVSAGTFEGDLVMDGRCVPGPAVAQPYAHQDEQQVFNGKRVLVIEDSEDNQLLISRYLGAVGIQVDLASNGFEGLEKLEKSLYDLVVLDIQMPGMDGHQVARTLRDKGFVQPIIALTAHAFKEDRERAFRNGINEYLTKPINRSVLLRTLSNRLGASPLH